VHLISISPACAPGRRFNGSVSEVFLPFNGGVAEVFL
jgi:hypothetical protein